MRISKNKICQICDLEYVPQGTIAQSTISKYCSRQCYYKSLIGRVGNREGTGPKKQCIICGNIFKKGGRTKDQFQVAKYCSVKCLSSSKVGVLRPDTSELMSKIGGKGVRHHGKEHWNWKGGVTDENHLLRNAPRYNKWRLKVYGRDYWTCQMCLVKQNHPIAHHIKSWKEYPKLRYIVKNGLTVCRSCHKKIHSEVGFDSRFSLVD